MIPIGFVSDHMEVKYDLDTEAVAKAAELGLPVARAATVGTDPRFTAAVRELVLERAATERGLAPRRCALGALGASHDVCAVDCCPNPRAPGLPPRRPDRSHTEPRSTVPDQMPSDRQQSDRPQPDAALLDELLALALEAARLAGALLRDGRPADLGVAATKSSPVDVVTEMDLASEKLIVELITGRRPQDGYLGEEGTERSGTSGVRWVVDPLDGTVNYLYGLPNWGVSVAAEYHGQVVVGVVDAPARRELFQAVLGRGATLDGRTLSGRPTPPWGRRWSPPVSTTCCRTGCTRPRYCTA